MVPVNDSVRWLVPLGTNFCLCVIQSEPKPGTTSPSFLIFVSFSSLRQLPSQGQPKLDGPSVHHCLQVVSSKASKAPRLMPIEILRKFHSEF